MKKITWHIETRDIAKLTGSEYNPRTRTPKEKKDLQRSIEEFGTVEPGVINIGARENILIGGHGRMEIYQETGRTEMEVMVPDRALTLEEEKELNLRLNKNTGSWDKDKLADIDIGLLLEVGFGEEDLAYLFDDVDVIDDDYNVSKALKDITKPITKQGDVWSLGDSRLMCGDSMDATQVDKLMGGEFADMIFNDPPYNIGVDYTKGTNTGPKQKKRKEFREGTATYKNDKKKDQEYQELIDTTLTNALAHSKPNAHVFYWCDERYIWLIQGLYEQHGISNKRVAIWIKNNFSLTPQVAFNKVYEPCVYGTRGKPYLNRDIRNLNEVLNKEVGVGNATHADIMDILTIWIAKRDAPQDYMHPTQKPVTLAEKPIKRCTGAGHLVLDLFGGSGTTLIASTQLGRKCYMMEEDPVFASIIIDRWEKFTNKKAKKV